MIELSFHIPVCLNKKGLCPYPVFKITSNFTCTIHVMAIQNSYWMNWKWRAFSLLIVVDSIISFFPVLAFIVIRRSYIRESVQSVFHFGYRVIYHLFMMVLTTNSFFSGNGNRTQTATSRSDRRDGSQSRVTPTNQDRRETVVVSSQELRQIFESIKILSNTVKEQNGKLEQLTNDLSFVKDELVKLSTTVDGLKSELPLIKEAANEQTGSQHYGPVPKAVKVNR